MALLIVRVFFLIISTIVGYQIGSFFQEVGRNVAILGAGIGFLGSLILIGLELSMRKISIRGLSAVVFGLLFGLIIARLITSFFMVFPENRLYSSIFQLIMTLVFCYLGVVIALRGKDEFSLIIPYVKFTRHNQREEKIILDTSVIIDGRIADIAKTGFVEGRFIIPRFVLKELQNIADSDDSLRRNRGRRGLDILNKIKKIPNIDVKIHEEQFSEIKEVDDKLVKLTTLLEAKILTNDYNLNKIAELEGVTVLNINELANALKPVVLPGETFGIRLVREGKEYNQAIAYLDDGTMVVIDEAKHLIGKNIKVEVTSVLQTSAGRMIFAKLRG